MKDELTGLFRERFSGHEAPVDAGLWDAIQGQLGAEGAAAGDEGLKDLFRERFTGYEVPVDPGVWTSISSQIGQGVATTSGASVGLGPLGWAAAGIGVLAIAGAAYLLSPTETTPSPVLEPRVEQAVPTPEEEPAVAVSPVITEENASKERTPSSTVTAAVPTPAPIPYSGTTEPAAVTEPQPTPLPIEPTPTRSDPKGAVLVENIISELTTRVTQEVLAEAAQRSTLDNTPTNGDAEVQPPAEVAGKQEDVLPELFLHNTFTPNGDGVNDTYSAVIDPQAFERVMMRIYDVRNNRLVFSTNTNEPWTGDGCLDGYFLVAVEAITPNGRLMTQGKVVWLNRNAVH